MVNIRISTKAVILDRLRYHPGTPVSGEVLAAEAAISRVGIWKSVVALRSAGYTISSGEDGYRLDPEAADDFLYSWEFGLRENLIHHWPATDSTMNRARELADRGVDCGTLAVAETQHAGRGRAGRRWRSEPGGLFFTLIERPRRAISDYFSETIAVQLAVSRAIGTATGSDAQLRWPNDIYVRGQKVAGVLAELRGEGDRLAWMNIGVGVNVNNAIHDPGATCCSSLANRRISRRELLIAILDELGKLKKENHGGRELAALWNLAAEGRQRQVAVIDPLHGTIPTLSRRKARWVGRFLGIDARGRAMLDGPRGLRRYAPGSASLVFIP